jgi:methionyl-tRNA formyltransferase
MNDQSLRIVFMGTPDFSVAALKAIIGSRHHVICVYTQPPRPKGRGQQLQKSPVHLAAEEAGIPVRHPLSLKKDERARQDFIDLKADVAVVAAYGLILPRSVLDAPRFGCINIHASLLPRWRGASPIQRAIWAGDAESGITIMQMEEGLDTGPMIAKRSVSIGPKMTTPMLHDALAEMGGKLIVPVLDTLAAEGKISAEKQDESLTNYAALLSKGDGRVDWSQSAVEIDRQIRALNPWPGVWTMTPDGKRLKILEAELTQETAQEKPGTLCAKDGSVSCGQGAILRLKKIQPDNAKPMDIASSLNGGYLKLGESLI